MSEILNLQQFSTYESPEKHTSTSSKCCTSTKRQSPTSFQEPSPKKRAALEPSSSPHQKDDQHFLDGGYTKLSLAPHGLPVVSAVPISPLRRTFSEPIYSVIPPVQEIGDLRIGQDSFPYPKVPQPPITAFTGPAVSTAVAATPPRPPLPRNVSKCHGFGESPEARRMERMKERLKVMNTWMTELVNDAHDVVEVVADDVAAPTTESDVIIPNQGETETELAVQMQEPAGKDPSTQEAVWVDKKGEFVILHLRCPCSNGYQILIRGTDCYYKLIHMD